MAEEQHYKFHCLRAVIDGGHLAGLSELESKVYISLYHDADGRTCRVAVSTERIARNSGTANVNRARKTAQQLEAKGLIRKVCQGGGRWLVNEWELLTPPPRPATPLFETGTPSVLVSEEETGTGTVPVSDGNRDAQRLETGTLSDRKQGRSASETGTLSVPHSQYSQKSQHISRGVEVCAVPLKKTPPPTPTPPSPPTPTPSTLPAAPAPHDPAVLNFLSVRGIHLHPARRYAAAYTLEGVQALWKKMLDKPKVRDKAALFNSILNQNMPTEAK